MHLLYIPLTIATALMDFLFGIKDWHFIPTHDPRNGLVAGQMITVQKGRCAWTRKCIWWFRQTILRGYIKPPVGFKVSLRNAVLKKHIDTYHLGKITHDRLTSIVEANNRTAAQVMERRK